MLEGIRQQLNGLLEYRLNDSFEINFVERRWLNASGNCGSVPAQSHSIAIDGGPIHTIDRCPIELGHGVAEAPDWARALVAHEVFHCFQYDAFRGSFDDWNNSGYDLDAPTSIGYVVEGAAAWVGEELARGTDFSRNWWRYYITGRERHRNLPGQFDLFGSNYDGIGFYAHIAAHGGNVWRQVLPIVNMSGAQAFERLLSTAPAERHALANWPSSVARTGWRGGTWDVAGHRVPNSFRRIPAQTAVLRAGGHVDLDERTGAQRLFEIPVADDVGLIRLGGNGYGRAAFDGDGDRHFEGPTDLTWCVREGGCSCAGGSLPPDVIQVGHRRRFLVAVAGGPRSAAALSLTARRICEQEPDAGNPSCDPCLEGTWHIDRENERIALQSVVPSARLNLRGDVVLRFTRSNCSAVGEYRRYGIDMLLPGTLAVPTRVVANGPVSARVRTQGQNFISDNVVNQASFEAGVVLNGTLQRAPVPVDSSMFNSVPSSARYRCSPSSLQFEIDTPSGTRTLRYTR